MSSANSTSSKFEMNLAMFWIAGMGTVALVIDLMSYGDVNEQIPSSFYYSVLILMSVLMARFAWKKSLYKRKDFLVMFFVVCVLIESLLEVTGRIVKIGMPDLLLDLCWIVSAIMFSKVSPEVDE